MADVRELIEDASKGAEITVKLETARIFAVCDDGTVYYLENLIVRAPLKVREYKKQGLVDLLKALPRKS